MSKKGVKSNASGCFAGRGRGYIEVGYMSIGYREGGDLFPSGRVGERDKYEISAVAE